MLQITIKILLTSVLVVAISEAAKRSNVLGAVLASLPLTSLLAFVWLWADTRDTEKIAALAGDILWLVLPSLVLFVVLPVMLRAGIAFWPSLIASCAATVAAYGLTLAILRRLTG